MQDTEQTRFFESFPILYYLHDRWGRQEDTCAAPQIAPTRSLASLALAQHRCQMASLHVHSQSLPPCFLLPLHPGSAGKIAAPARPQGNLWPLAVHLNLWAGQRTL